MSRGLPGRIGVSAMRSVETAERNAAAFRVAYGEGGGVISSGHGITRPGYIPPKDMRVLLDGETEPLNVGARTQNLKNSLLRTVLSSREAAVLQRYGVPITGDGKKIDSTALYDRGLPVVQVVPVAGSGLGSSAAGPSGPVAGVSGAAGGGVPVRDEAGRMRAAASVWASRNRSLQGALEVSQAQWAAELDAFNRLSPEERESYGRLVDQRMAGQWTAAAARQEVSPAYDRSVGGGAGPSNATAHASSTAVMPPPANAGASRSR
ncbi:hypothetical protein QFZ63_000021 [Streptomyces sp. B3I7]|nr:hypothetical protein [Streptomyces sp. B3I7]